MSRKRKKETGSKFCTIYVPKNQTITATIKSAYEHMNLRNEDGSKLSLGKFVLVHALRDLTRMMEMAADATLKQQEEELAANETSNPDDKENSDDQ